MPQWRTDAQKKDERELLIASKEAEHCKRYKRHITLAVDALRVGPATVSELASRMKTTLNAVRLALIGARILGCAAPIKPARDYKVWPYGRDEGPTGVEIDPPQWGLSA